MYQMPLPITCGFLGAFAGSIGGGCAQTFPIWVGALSGVCLGSILSTMYMCMPEVEPQTVIVQNIVGGAKGEPLESS